jgi:hypothetical protein
MRPSRHPRFRLALTLGALIVALACLLGGTAALAARARGGQRASRKSIERTSTRLKQRKRAVTPSASSRKSASKAPKGASSPAPQSPPVSAPAKSPAPSGGRVSSRAALEEGPELADEPAGFDSEEESEANPLLAGEEESEEASESEETTSEAPSEEEVHGEYSEIPGPHTQRKYAGELPSFAGGEALTDAIDPRFLTYLPFGTTSFWIQPWRAYLDTWPASRLLNAIGVNFTGSGSDARAIAQLLGDSGFKLARKGIFWDAVSYEHPDQLRDPGKTAAALELLHEHGLRPLIVLDADSQAPGPSIRVSLQTTTPASAGAQTVQLSAASAAQVVPWKTGFDGLAFGGSPDVLITSVSPSGVASLSRPLGQALPAGAHGGTTLRYVPFESPTLPGGEPNPVFGETLDGWLQYVGAVSHEAASVLGPGGFDLEVWNELSFGSQYLNIEHYEPAGPATKATKKATSKAIRRAILAATVAYVRNPANGLSPSVGVTDGFASQTPFPSGADAPVGLTALSKHPYVGAKSYPAAYNGRQSAPIDALGNRDTAANSLAPLFMPTYQSLMPEFTISGNWSEDLLRDVAPFTTYVYGFPHGRFVGPAGGTPPQKWITEFNMAPGRGVPMAPDGVTPESGVTLSAADRAHFQAKALLRDVVAMVGKGFARDYVYHASQTKSGALNIVSPSFVAALEAHPNTYPGDSAGGETLTGFRGMLARLQGPGPSGTARQLTLESITQQGEHAQFAGDGSAAHPSLYDREALAVFPFQSSPTRFVIPVYVMTRDLLTLYEPSQPASDIERYDLPNETFRVTLGNLPEGGAPPTVSEYDPLRDESVPARLVSREGSGATFEVAATDYPRLLTLQF